MTKQNIRRILLRVSLLIGFLLVIAGNVFIAQAQPFAPKPILLVLNDSAPNVYGKYLGEILRAEGLNSYVTTTVDVSAATMAQYRVVILAETPLTALQAAEFSTYVTGGGYLIAMRPDSQISNLFGLGAYQGTQNDGYLKMNGTGPSKGLSTETLQIHGMSDRYTVATGGIVLAQLYSNAVTATSYPSVIQGATGHGIAFTFDLASSVVLMRQGNPANANIDIDGDGILRTIDLFQGSGGAPPWVDLDKVHVPQADEQQRLFASLVRQAIGVNQPMPQLWYFPDTAKTMMIVTGDEHGNPYAYWTGVLDNVNAHHGRMTIYITPSSDTVINDDLVGWIAQGNSFGMHPDIEPQLATSTIFQDAVQDTKTWYTNRYSVPMSATIRNHQLAWLGWTEAAEIESAAGFKMSTDFYTWGPWLQKADSSWAHGYTTGSSQPMKFVKADGTILPYYQQQTSIVDEQIFPIAGGFEGPSIPAALAVTQQLIDASLDGYYSALMAQFHIDYDSWNEVSGWVSGTLDYAYDHNIPIWNADEWLKFTETRYDATYSNMVWDEATRSLTFDMTAATTPDVHLSTMLPLGFSNSPLISVSVDGVEVPYTVQTINGTNVAFVTTAAGDHSFSVAYRPPDLSDAAPTLNYYTALPVTLTWNRISWATEYEINVADNQAFNLPLAFVTTVPGGSLSAAINSLTKGTYYWRVRVKNSKNVWSKWSKFDSFTLLIP